MKRRQWFEWEDQAWFPVTLRNYMTDFLQLVANRFNFYHALVPVLANTLQGSQNAKVVDLCAGGGGGWERLVELLKSEVPELRILLTDRYPNLAAFERTQQVHPSVFEFESRPIDALNVPTDLEGMRTVFLAFHHFSPNAAIKILANAVAARQPILIVEAQKRDLFHLLKFAFSPIAVALMTPLLRPFHWTRLLFTYVLPLIPLCVGWDGVVSVLRTYSLAEMLALAERADSSGEFEWSAEEVMSGQVTLPVFAWCASKRLTRRPGQSSKLASKLAGVACTAPSHVCVRFSPERRICLLI